MFQVLLIGAGTMGSVHARAYGQMENAKLAGIVDIQEERGKKLADELGAAYFPSFEEASSILEQVDIIDVCLPTPFHKEYVIKAADAGKHVICEKPLARHLSEAEEMLAYCKEKNVRLFVGHVLRFFPEYAKAKGILDSGSIGNTAVVRTTRGGGFPRAWNNWYGKFDWSGGLILDMIIHDFDFLRWCYGDVERVYAKGLCNSSMEDLDYALVTLRFKNGTIAHVEGTWAHESFSMKFEMAGQTGIVQYDSAKETPLVAISRRKSEGAAGVAVPESPLKENPYFLELQHFLHCIETGQDSIVNAQDAYEAMRIALAAIESIQTGKAVTL